MICDDIKLPESELPPTLLMKCKIDLQNIVSRLNNTGNDEICDEIMKIVNKY